MTRTSRYILYPRKPRYECPLPYLCSCTTSWRGVPYSYADPLRSRALLCVTELRTCDGRSAHTLSAGVLLRSMRVAHPAVHTMWERRKETELTQPVRVSNCVSGTRKWWAPADLPPPRAASPARRAQLRANSSRFPISRCARGARRSPSPWQPATTCRHHASAPAPAPSATEATASASAHVMQPPQRIRRSERAKVADDDDSTCDCFDIFCSGIFVKN